MTVRTSHEPGGVPSEEQFPAGKAENVQRFYLGCVCVSRSAKEQDGGRAREKIEKISSVALHLRQPENAGRALPGSGRALEGAKTAVISHVIRIHLKQGEGYAASP